VFAQRSAGFEELVGDYSALPSTYLPEDYARDTQGLNVVGTVWAEFISDNPVDEVRWADELMHATTRPTGMIALVDFLSPDLKHTLLRYAQRPDLLSDLAWRRGIDLLRGRVKSTRLGHSLNEFEWLFSAGRWTLTSKTQLG
jgi:hypothetical protein